MKCSSTISWYSNRPVSTTDECLQSKWRIRRTQTAFSSHCYTPAHCMLIMSGIQCFISVWYRGSPVLETVIWRVRLQVLTYVVHVHCKAGFETSVLTDEKTKTSFSMHWDGRYKATWGSHIVLGKLTRSLSCPLFRNSGALIEITVPYWYKELVMVTSLWGTPETPWPLRFHSGQFHDRNDSRYRLKMVFPSCTSGLLQCRQSSQSRFLLQACIAFLHFDYKKLGRSLIEAIFLCIFLFGLGTRFVERRKTGPVWRRPFHD